MGTSVRVAKYMKAPTTDAKKFEKTEFPPTRADIHSFGITPAIVLPSWVDPKRNPAATTPRASNGMISFAKSHVAMVHALFSSSFLSKRVMTLSEMMATSIGIRGINFWLLIKVEDKTADKTVIKTAARTHCHLILNILINEYPSISPKKPVIYHLLAQI